MTNKQYLIIAAIKASLKTLIPASLAFVGEYPDDKIGSKFPAVLIKDSDESYEYLTGKMMKVTMQIELVLYSEVKPGITRQKMILDTQNAINNILTKDLTLTGTVDNSYIVSISKGEVADTGDGYSGTLSQRTITFEVTFRNERE